MKVKIWIGTTCVPDESEPCAPYAWATQEDADAGMLKLLREEWEARGEVENADGEPVQFPETWQEANDILRAGYPEWGQWMLFTEYVNITLPRIAIVLDGGLVQAVITDDPRLVDDRLAVFPDVLVIDYDVEGSEPSEVSPITQGDGTIDKAFVRLTEITKSEIDLESAWQNAVAELESALQDATEGQF